MKVLQAPRRVSVLVGAAAATAVRSALCDTQNARNAAICVSLGALANTSTGVKARITIEESDVTNTGFATWDSAFNLVEAASVGAHVFTANIPLGERKRHLKLTVTPGTTVATDALAVAAIGEFDDAVRS